MKVKLYLLFPLLFLCFSMFGQQSNFRKGILILGSHHLPTLQERVETGFALFTLKKNVDYVIVSGGCGAHDSDFCEASEMLKLLKQKGIPEELLYKEELSKSTFQNYCYSRKLQDEKGEQIIQKGDSLFIVSNHWHAIPVAARFREFDEVQAEYFIAGSITPKTTDVVNYGNMFTEESSECVCAEILK